MELLNGKDVSAKLKDDLNKIIPYLNLEGDTPINEK